MKRWSVGLVGAAVWLIVGAVMALLGGCGMQTVVTTEAVVKAAQLCDSEDGLESISNAHVSFSGHRYIIVFTCRNGARVELSSPLGDRKVVVGG